MDAEPITLPPPTATPLSLIDKAIERGIDPDKLGKLIDLQERWMAARAVESYNAAMNRAQAEMPTVVRDAENKSTHSRYATREAVNRIIKPVYTKHGFSLCFSTADSPLPDHIRILCDVRHVDGHCVQHRLDTPLDGKGAKGGATSMNAPQATGSTTSYGCRYLAYMIFNLTVADEDTDGNGQSRLVGPEEIRQINDLLEDCRKAGKPLKDFRKFLAWCAEISRVPAEGFDSLEHLPLSALPTVLDYLSRKTANGGPKP